MGRRKYVDMGRLREALAGPGADTRVWIAAARVDDDVDAMRWEPDIGWLVDVTFYGGTLDGVGPVCCRMAGDFASAGATRSDPVARRDEVVVAINDGDPNANPVIIGFAHNSDMAVPATIFGLPVDEALVLLNHVLVSPHGLMEEYALAARQRALSWLLEGLTIALAGQVSLGVTTLPTGEVVPPTQPMIRGADFTGATLGLLVTALNTYATAVGVAVPAAAGAATALATALQGFQLAAVGNLSTRVVGE